MLNLAFIVIKVYLYLTLKRWTKVIFLILLDIFNDCNDVQIYKIYVKLIYSIKINKMAMVYKISRRKFCCRRSVWEHTTIQK